MRAELDWISCIQFGRNTSVLKPDKLRRIGECFTQAFGC